MGSSKPISASRADLGAAPAQSGTAAPPAMSTQGHSSSRLGDTVAAGAAAAQKGVVTISVFVQKNPVAVQLICCLMGLALSVCSILSLIGVIDHDPQRSDQEKLRDGIQHIYTTFFGLVIVVCDSKPEWMDKCFGVQAMLYKYLYFLATQTGRAVFYLYVGSITLLMLPENDLWKVVYFCLGGALAALGLLQVVLRLCCKQPDELEMRANG
uniref:Uncharacterized protein n=1 Tax=Alexandrium monilatum TaxID=311494 RepID=A0A7S4RLN6_9DINO